MGIPVAFPTNQLRRWDLSKMPERTLSLYALITIPFAILFTAWCVPANAATKDESEIKIVGSYCDNKWCVAETSNFRVCSELTLEDSRRVARRAEVLRGLLS